MITTHYVTYHLSLLSSFIGYPATVFLTSLLILIIVRIGFAFIFKIFKLSIDYDRINKK